MKIKKIGHCCLLIQTNNLTILTDPGTFTVEQNTLTGIDVILITHEHGDHFHIASVEEILKNNPHAKVITNSAVGKKLEEKGIAHSVVEGRDTLDVKGMIIEAFDGKHEEIFEEIGQVQNTGYLIDNTLFYPGDSFHKPEREVEVLALPIAGPWCKLPDAIRYALAVKPKKAFPVHDALLRPDLIGGSHKMYENILNAKGIEFTSMNDGDEKEF